MSSWRTETGHEIFHKARAKASEVLVKAIAKHQTPENSKSQAPRRRRQVNWDLGIGISSVFGAWCLVFGVSDFPTVRHRRKNIYLTAVPDTFGP